MRLWRSRLGQKLIERLGEAAKLPFPIHAHMVRHAAGYALGGTRNRYKDTAGLYGPSLDRKQVVYTAVAEPPKHLGQVSVNVVSTPARHCNQRILALDAEWLSGVRQGGYDCVCSDRSVQRWSDCSGNDDI